MSNSSKIILGKHNADITNVTLSVNGEMAASCSNDRTVMLYDVNNKKIKGHLYGFSGNPVCVALDETGEKLFVTVNDGTIQVYDTNKITPLNDDVSAPHIGSVLLESVKYTSSGDVVSCGEDGYIKKWNPQTGKCFFSSKKITPRPESFTVSPDGLLMAYCYGEHCVIVDTKNDRELFRKHTGKITPYQMALNGRVVFITTRNGDLVRIFYRNRFWGQLKYSREQIGDGTIQSSILFADKQGFFAFCNTVSGKNKIHQYNLSGKKGKTINIHNTYHSGIRLQDGTMVLSGLGKIDFLSPTKGTVIRSIDTPPMSSHLIMAYSPCNNLIAATSSDSVLRVWNINADKGNELLAVFGGGKVFSSITFSPDGKQIIAGDESGLLTWFDIVFL
jgi:WD40 repeat protein